ncbi:MAG: uroporphyrinogen decarboxylase family protein [Candidatus Omnitrophota bacterium]
MSYEIGMEIMNLQMPERVGRTEYCDHTTLVRHITGFDPLSKDPEEQKKARQKFYQELNFDFLWNNNDGPVAWPDLGRITDMGHAVYMEGGTDFRDNLVCPFKTPEEVLSFDAAKEYGLPDIAERAKYFQQNYLEGQKNYPDMVFPGGYYKTIVSGCIQSFGWDMFLLGVGTDPERFGEYVLEGFFQLTLANIKAWAGTDIKVFVSHDDMVWTRGAIFKPEWYRKYVFPRYKKLWQPLKEKGIKILFCSDGNFTEFVDDIASAGADGFIFEPLTSLELIVQKYGKTHVIVGNADCRILTFNTKEDIEREVKRCMDVAKTCPGFIMAVGNHIPANIPIDNALYYFDLVKKYGKR